MAKILIIRFSSIGDIVLTTPVVRCLKQQLPAVELHYLTKLSFYEVIEHNPYIDKIHTINRSISEITSLLKAERFDCIIDLHHNARTLRLKSILKKPSFSFHKLNWEKFMLVHFKLHKLPHQHIVDRYLKAVEEIGVINDQKGLDYFISANDTVTISDVLPALFHQGYHALVVGGSYYTKKIPENKLKEICEKSSKPLVLLGGKGDDDVAEMVYQSFKDKTINLCGRLTLNQSASILQQSTKVITSDTGLMHIAAAYKKDVISLWGNTIPEFGMGPYLAGENSQILEVKQLPCRPCSKLGYNKCPKKHFKCMNDLIIPDV